MIVQITEWDKSLARFIATGRHRANRESNVKNLMLGYDDELQGDIDGMIGELVFARKFNLYPDLEVGVRSGGHDFISKQGATIDVKTTTRRNGKLLAHVSKVNHPSDIYVLIILMDDSAYIAGYLEGTELMTEKYMTDLGYGPVYAARQDELKRFKQKR